MSTPSIVVVGSNHECASIDLRERLAFTGDTLAGGLVALRQHVDEGLIVSTCNRTELYVVTDDPDRGRDRVFDFLTQYHQMPAHTLDGMAYVHTGADAVRHFFRVASGLDSLVLGEPQILAQIRDALDAARDAGSVGPYLQRLATDALRVGKRVRTDTSIARNKLSISHAAVELAARERPDLANLRVTLLGAGKMAAIAARVLAAQGVEKLTIVNRSLPKAHALATELGAQARPLDDLASAVADSDVVIGAVLTDDPMIGPDMLAERREPVLLLDLGIPRIIDPVCSEIPGVDMRDIDDLDRVADETRRRYASEMAKAEELIGIATGDYERWARSHRASGAIGRLRHRSDEVRDAEVQRALKRLGHLSDRDQKVVRAMAKALTNTLMHEPVQALRGAGSPEDIQTILATFGIDGGELDEPTRPDS